MIHGFFKSQFATIQHLDRHPVSQLMRRMGDIEEMAFDGDQTVYAICHRQTTGHLIRFEIEEDTCVDLGDLGFAALNLARSLPRETASNERRGE